MEDTEKTVARLQAQIAMLGQENAKLKETVQQQGNNTMQYFQFVVQKLMAVEQAHESLRKLSHSLTDELIGLGTVTNHAIMTRIRRHEEGEEKGRIAGLVTSNTLKAQETVDGGSTIAYSQNIVKGESVSVVAEYRVLELGSEKVPEDIRAVFVGKKVGDTVELPAGEDKCVITILEVFSLVTGEKPGETQPESKEAPTPEAQTEVQPQETAPSGA